MTEERRPAHGYAVPDVAADLGVCPTTVARWLRANADGGRSHIDVGGVRVPAVRIGRRWVFVEAPLDTATEGDAVEVVSNEPTPPASSRCPDCSAGQHHGCVVWGGACGCGRSIDEVWSDIEAWARRTGRLPTAEA